MGKDPPDLFLFNVLQDVDDTIKPTIRQIRRMVFIGVDLLHKIIIRPQKNNNSGPI